MFREAKENDRVWSSVYDWGTIYGTNHSESRPIWVKFDKGAYKYFTLDGKQNENDVFPSLFWDEIKFEIPKKPFKVEDELRKLKVKEFVYGENNNYCLCWDNDDNKMGYTSIVYAEIPMAVYFDDYCALKNTITCINKHGITKEQFLKAYKKVFGGKE